MGIAWVNFASFAWASRHLIRSVVRMFPQQPRNPFAPVVQPGVGSKDGEGAGDRDRPYAPRQLSVLSPFPFTTREYARLLVLRGRVRDGLCTEYGDVLPAA